MSQLHLDDTEKVRNRDSKGAMIIFLEDIKSNLDTSNPLNFAIHKVFLYFRSKMVLA